ncbi:MAG: hypothetical protein ACRDZZ_08270, partial [Ilumatobacteraceae bacterium]
SRAPLRAAVVADLRASGWGRRLALGGVVFWLGYEWGIGNETVTPWLLARVVADRPGADAVPAAAAVGFAFTAAQQLLAGLTALVGFSMFGRTTQAAWDRLRVRFESVPGEWSGLGLVGRSALVFALGTTAVALVQVMATGEVGLRRHRRTILESSLLCGALVGIGGAAAAGLAVAGREIDAMAGATERVLDVLGNPLFWLGVLLLALVVHLARNAVRTRRVAEPAGEQPASE